MANGFGAKVKLEGESEFRSALKDINSSLKLVSSELKLTSAEFQHGDKSIKDTKNSFNSMNSAVQEQKEKIASLKETVAEMTKKYGEDNEQVKQFKTQLNNAEAKLVEMDNTTDKSNKDLKEMKDRFDDAGTSGLKFGDILKANVISDAIVGGFKMLGNAVKEMGSAMLGLGKQAIDSFAEYQQLSGGIETIFAESKKEIADFEKFYGKSWEELKNSPEGFTTTADQVLAYANEAYKTAGVSANEYMQGVTSFSASLLQSVKGNSYEAMEVANQAFIDMSDNANKMGTDMSSIQSAYQGFAKQNYTMLDNLKLGYGGTKTEMERLLADAQKISGVKYDINNLSDVYNAIHVIQGELGITGTTAKEAGTTISGSVNMMKASWTNLVTSLANENANIGEMVSNLVTTIVGDGTEDNLGVLGNVLPAIQTITEKVMEVLPMILDNIVAQLPSFLDAGVSILQKLIDGIQQNLPAIMNAVMTIISTILNTLVANLPQILQMGIQVIVSLIQGISQQLPTLIPQIIEAVVLMVETLLDNIDMIIDAGIQLILALADGLLNALPDLIDKIPIIIDKLVIAITDNLPKIIEMGIELTIKLALGLVKAIPQLVSKIPQIISSLINGIKNYYSKIFSIGGELLGKVKDGIVSGISGIVDVGKRIVQGLWQGISDAKNWVLEKVKGFGKSVLNGLKSFFGIKSPSRLFRDEIGHNLALGIGEGFSEEMQEVNKDIANSLPTEFDTSVNTNLSSNVNGGFTNTYDNMVLAFKEALKEVRVVMNDTEMGTFVTDTVERVVYSR